MAYFAAFAYSSTIETKGQISVPQELSTLGFNRLTSFHNNLSDGWAYVVESDLLIVLAFRGTRSTINGETNLHAWLIHPADRVYDVIGEVLSINDVNLPEMLREAA